MPFSVPLPLGGFATELGSLNERQRSLEALRVTGSSASYAPSVTVPDGSVWVTPTGWPSIYVPACYIGGAVLFFGATITDPSEAVGAGIGVSLDGVAPDNTGAFVGGSGNHFTVLGVPIGAMWVIAPVSLANHTYQLVANNNSGSTAHLTNAFLTVDPF